MAHHPWFDEEARAALEADLAELDKTEPLVAAAARQYRAMVEEVLGGMVSDFSPESGAALRAYLGSDEWRRHAIQIMVGRPCGHRYLYYCPTSGENECPDCGGFDECCPYPQLHRNPVTESR